MIDADRIAWTHYRAAAGGREPIAPAHDGIHYTPPRRVGLGVITSRPAPGPTTPPPDILAAIRSGARQCPRSR